MEASRPSSGLVPKGVEAPSLSLSAVTRVPLQVAPGAHRYCQGHAGQGQPSLPTCPDSAGSLSLTLRESSVSGQAVSIDVGRFLLSPTLGHQCWLQTRSDEDLDGAWNVTNILCPQDSSMAPHSFGCSALGFLVTENRLKGEAASWLRIRTTDQLF